MYKKLSILILVIISLQLLAQNQIISKDIADIVQPNPEVELFYGNAQYSADKIVILPNYIIIYDAFTATFHLLDKETRLSLDNLCLFDIKGIKTHRNRFVDENGKTFMVLKTPFNVSTFMNKVNICSLSDSSFYGGLIKIKKEYKTINIFVHNDSLKLELINFNSSKDFKQLTKKQKRKENLRFNKFSARMYKNYVSTDNYYYINPLCPYSNKKSIEYKSETGISHSRDSSLNYNCIYYRKHGTDSFKLLYKNSYEDVLALRKYKKSGFWFYNEIITSNNKLIYYSNSFDSLIVFDKNHKRIFASTLYNPAKKYFEGFADNNSVKAWDNYYFHIYKDEFTEKLYIIIPYKNGENIISELDFNYKTQKPEFNFLRKYKVSNARHEIVTINKGILYLSTTNSLVGNNYVYQYDLYKGLKNKDKLLKINFYAVNKIKHKSNSKYNWVTSLNKYNKPEPLSKKEIKKYFGKIKKDTILYNQSTQLNTIKSVIKSIINDSITYAFSQLFMYKGIIRLEIEDDIKAKNYMYFKDIIEDMNKEKALNDFNYIIENWDESEKELYNHKKIAIKMPNGMFFYMYKKDDYWYLDSVIRTIKYEDEVN